jgi:hypothetical protein
MVIETITMTTPTHFEMNIESPMKEKKPRDPTKWLRKTRLCVYNIQGVCHLGSKCTFAHSVGEVQDAPSLYKTQLCAAYAEGNCENEYCTFAHGEEELRLSPNYKNKLCKWFDVGKCRNGNECGFAHGEGQLRTQPVETFPTGDVIDPPPGLSNVGKAGDNNECQIAFEEDAPCREDSTSEESTGGGVIPPPGLESQKPFVLDLESSLLESKAEPSLEEKVQGMSANIAALKWKMDDLLVRTQGHGMEHCLSAFEMIGQLSSQCAELEHVVNPGSETTGTSVSFIQPQRTKLRSRASPFKPSSLSSNAAPFVPSFGADTLSIDAEPFVPSADKGYDSCWPSDDSTDVGSSSDSGAQSSD